MKKFLVLIITIACSLFVISGCAKESEKSGTESPTFAPSVPGTEVESVTIEGITFSKYDMTSTWSDDAVKINMNGSEVTFEGTGARQSGKKVLIEYEGTYILSGNLTDGQIVVEVEKTEKVQLVLNGVNISCSDSAPLYIKSADKVSLTLPEGSDNVLTDAVNYVFETPGLDKPNSCIFSEDDLTINGTGKLTVNANYNNGIGTKNDLRIISGTLNVKAVNNALKGNDTVVIKDGTINIESDDDGIKSDNETEENRGCVYIFGGTVNIEAGDDSIQAYTKVKITGGTVTEKSIGKDINCEVIEVTEGCLINA